MTHEPMRFRDDPDAPVDLRSDLANLSSSDPPFDLDAGLARLTASIPGAPAAPTAASTAPAKGAATFASQGALWKIAAVGIAAVGVAFAGVHYASRATAPPPPADVASPVEAVASIDAESAVAPANPPPAETAVAVEAPPAKDAAGRAPIAPRHVDAPARTTPPPATAAPSVTASAPTADDLLAQDIAQLAETRAASGNPSRALSLADDGLRRFPGQFSQEREAIAIGALASLGRAGEARARAEAFVARHPKSPLVERVKKTAGIQ